MLLLRTTSRAWRPRRLTPRGIVGIDVANTLLARWPDFDATDCAGRLSTAAPYHSPPAECKYVYVRDDVPQGLAAVMLASTEMEF